MGHGGLAPKERPVKRIQQIFLILQGEEPEIAPATAQVVLSTVPSIPQMPQGVVDPQPPDSDEATATEVDNLLAHIQRVLAGYSDDRPDNPADTNGAQCGESPF